MSARFRRALVAFVGLLVAASPAGSARIKDVASVKGVRTNQIIGYGLVVGLNGTGDNVRTEFTVQSLASLLARMGIGVDAELVQVRNVAAVMVTADLHPFARTGARIDALVSSLGDAASLEGGTLLLTPLHGADGEVYAIAQGPLSVGGFSAGGGGASVQKNHPTVGRIAGGATVEREVAYSIEGRSKFEVALHDADFTTAQRVASAINAQFGTGTAQPRDAGTLDIEVPAGANVVAFLADLEALPVEPDRPARVVLNERTGTVVMGADVRISRVAVAHGSLSVTIATTNEVSQPNPFGGGETVPFSNTDVTAVEEEARLNLLGGGDGVTIDELVRGLNALGVTPRDLIAILQAIRASGAMSAELEVL